MSAESELVTINQNQDRFINILSGNLSSYNIKVILEEKGLYKEGSYALEGSPGTSTELTFTYGGTVCEEGSIKLVGKLNEENGSYDFDITHLQKSGRTENVSGHTTPKPVDGDASGGNDDRPSVEKLKDMIAKVTEEVGDSNVLGDLAKLAPEDRTAVKDSVLSLPSDEGVESSNYKPWDSVVGMPTTETDNPLAFCLKRCGCGSDGGTDASIVTTQNKQKAAPAVGVADLLLLDQEGDGK